MYSKNNTQSKDGIKKLKRWTVLNMRLDTVKDIKRYSSKNGLTIAATVSRLISKGIEVEDNEQ